MKKKYRRLGKLKAEKILQRLRSVRDTATMETAAFGFNDSVLTEMIRKETRIWRNSWIISPLTEIMEELNEIYSLEIK